MQILAGSHWKIIFKCGLSTKCVLYVLNILWPHDAVWHVPSGWVYQPAHVVGPMDVVGYSGGPADWCKHNSTLLDQPSPWSPAKEVLSPTEVHDIQLKSNSSALLLPKETTPLGWHTPTQMVKMLTHHLRELENKFHNEFHSDKALLSQKFLCPTSPQCDSGCRGYTWPNLT